MGEDLQKSSGMDWNKIISDLILRHEEAMVKIGAKAVKSAAQKVAVNCGAAFTDYLSRALDKYSSVKTLLYRNTPRFLYDFYEFNDIEDPDHKRICCDHIRTLLSSTQYNIIVGDGGSGKSMLMRHFFINALQECDCIPIFVELRFIDDRMPLMEYIYKSLHTLGFKQDIGAFCYALEQGKFIIILDGYDEVKPQARETFFIRLEEFCDLYHKNNIIVSTRKSDNFISWQRFSVYNILPLSKEHALNMIGKLDYDADIKEKFYQRLCDGLYDSHKSFASNPLLLSIMLLTFDQYADIPEKLHIFYSYAFDTLYSMHDATKAGYKRELRSTMSCDTFRMIFANFCFRTYMVGQYQFTKQEILTLLEQSGSKVENFEKESYFDDLLVAVCLICEEGRTYCFTHRSFQEYFAAVYLNALDDEKQKMACGVVLKARSGTIVSDKMFDMLRDMGEERFDRNYIIPTLTEIEECCPTLADPIQRYFYGTVERCCIYGNIRSLLEAGGFDMIVSLSQYRYPDENRTGILSVKFHNKLYGYFICTLHHYFKQEQRTVRQRLDVKYWEIPYTAEEIWNDSRLRDYFVHSSSLGYNIKLASTLLNKLGEKQKQADTDFQKILSSIMDS